jgi:hypothetical protein
VTRRGRSVRGKSWLDFERTCFGLGLVDYDNIIFAIMCFYLVLQMDRSEEVYIIQSSINTY